MSASDQSNADWTDCQAGEVQQLVQGLRATRRAKTFERRTTLAAVLVMVCVTSAWYAGVIPQSEPNYGGIVCSEVMQNGQKFTSKTLDEKTAGQIDIHLGQCEACRKQLENMQQDMRDKLQPGVDPGTRNNDAGSAVNGMAHRASSSRAPSLAGL